MYSADEEFEILDDSEEDSAVDLQQASVEPVIELSLNSVVGLTTPSTMKKTTPSTIKIIGNIFGLDVVVLIDCGATHNFISNKLVEKLNFFVVETSRYGMIMGIG